MLIEYKIKEEDFLTHQLYIASVSDRNIKKRKKIKIIPSVIYILLGLIIILLGDVPFGTTLIIIASLWYLIYPLWERRYYKSHFKNFIEDNYKDRIGKALTLEIQNEYLLSKGKGIELTLKTSEIEEIVEIPTLILIKIKGGQAFVLPINEIAYIENLKHSLRLLAKHVNVSYNVFENWKWK
jgi:hypothetical protein